jgi:hypothetical protein
MIMCSGSILTRGWARTPKSFFAYYEYGKNPMDLSCRPSGFYGPHSMDRNNYIDFHPTQAQVAKISYHHPSKYHR